MLYIFKKNETFNNTKIKQIKKRLEIRYFNGKTS